MSAVGFQNHVDINLIIHRDSEDIKIGFPFDTVNDDIGQIVAELKQTLGLSSDEEVDVRNSIRNQINEALRQSLTDFRQQIQPKEEEYSDGLDDEVFSDPEYKALLERQKAEIAAMEEMHLKQQRELMNAQTSPSNVPKVVDDLIVFS
ncbi:hypothetical protein TVAG_464700 [Trichomonas vaginalis G3]|uniref:Uncharacterized protein n=1 Tax=Trichomonas vaginalis (strain ATCC PRA-98 / G3) TaxID=412133 RepID=A2EEL5_TRIV3|nr:hypothetical protein TVAGG3_1055000 [Trichomonas vaginalis G3]EAY08922.1 hypothetical protein TVAG_464700 [Trichomonas vaginalis G3]KAI5494388.1 hypothetical protein TVAGG3_1055000 [Trichomonas vaginalis G3]|eukprot:XP_001321145.1 hypothetical protein [Trichomonas vaginalis G3]